MKLIIFLSVALIAIILFSCNPYRKITFSNSQFYKKERVKKNIDRYDVVVHDEDSTYLLTNPGLENNTLSGTLEAITLDNDDEISEEEKDDIHIYLDGNQREAEVADGKTVEISESQVEKAEMYAKDDDGVAGIFFTVLIIIGIVILALLLILVLAITSASNDAGSSSSGSDSGSGGSNSGGSNSGGSSCYIATMSYGSYDAPEVLVLRKFRDRFLKKFGMGRAFIRWYYANSPAFVEKHKSKKMLHKFLRWYLNGLVFIVKPFIRN